MFTCIVSKMSSSNTDIHSENGRQEMLFKPVKLEPDLAGILMQQKECHETSSAPHSSARSVLDQEPSPIDDSSFCSASPLNPAPLSRQFWRAGNYNESRASTPALQNGTSYLHIHPKFLHSNATSHKWAFGAVAELLDNAVDEIQNGATFVIVDKISNPRDGNPALLIRDDGGGMDPEAMRRCMSFGFSDKKSNSAIGQYGNGFKTSSMRLGADVIVFSRGMKNRKLTQSVGLLSYTFLMHTRHDRIVVPMVDYKFDAQTGSWKTLNSEQHKRSNLSILLQWSPYSTEAELLKQCDDVGPHGTKVIIYNLWQNDEGKIELDFESDPEDICIYGKANTAPKPGSRNTLNEQHLANRLRYSLRAYLSILYLRIPDTFSILLRGQVVESHNVANDLKFPQFILYKPQQVEGAVVTTIGFLKEAPHVNIHGFNVYHKNRLILPYWHVVSYSDSRGRGVVGVLEANFIEPTHNKQDFEKTPVFQKLETRLKEMTQEYWDYHCGLIGYQVKKKPRAINVSNVSSNFVNNHGTYQPVVLGPSAPGGATQHHVGLSNQVAARSGTSRPPLHQSSKGVPSKRKEHDNTIDAERLKRRSVVGSGPTGISNSEHVQNGLTPPDQSEDQEAAILIQENQKLKIQCQEYEKRQEELNLKAARLRTELQEVQRQYARMLLESKLLEKVKRERTAIT